jgi:hypothetical protein
MPSKNNFHKLENSLAVVMVVFVIRQQTHSNLDFGRVPLSKPVLNVRF